MFFLQDDLFLYQLLFVRYSVFSSIRSASLHNLVGNDTQAEEVTLEAMVLPPKHFWCHISGRTTRIRSIVSLPTSRQAKVNNFNPTVLIEHEVIRSHISMNYSIPVEEFQSNNDVGYYKLSLRLLELDLLNIEVVAEVSAIDVLIR